MSGLIAKQIHLRQAWLPVAGVMAIIGIVPGMPNAMFLIGAAAAGAIAWFGRPDVMPESEEDATPAGGPAAGGAESARPGTEAITAEDVTWLRKGILEAGTDYTREAGFVRITTAGLAKIEECIAREDTLIVIASNLPNPKLVLGRRPGEGEILRVRVADSTAWCKGMIMPDCRQGADRSGVYTCEARPRFKGRV
jgi:hypothetical protein